jgi:two-component system copper resistance phosphate regulon response regulator CusR
VRILVIEDEQKLGKALQEGLQAEQYGVALACTGEEGFYLVQTESFDLVILDVMLPGRSGIEILTTMRRHGLKTPVLILTARDAVEDRVRGLDHGADDYLVKPFAFPELLARIRVLCRRGVPEASPKFRVADLEVDVVGRSVTRGGLTLDLTASVIAAMWSPARCWLAMYGRKHPATPLWTTLSTCMWLGCDERLTISLTVS